MNRMTIDRPEQVVALIKNYARKRVEQFGVVLLDEGRNVIGKKVLFIGSSNSAIVSPKVVFWEACSKKAGAFIVFHNHPSGNVAPSQDDIDTTERLKGLGDDMCLPLLDHIIITREDYFSFKEHGLVLGDEKKEASVAEK